MENTLTTGTLEAISYKGNYRGIYVLNVWNDKVHALDCREMSQSMVDKLGEMIEPAQDAAKFYAEMPAELKRYYRTFNVDGIEGI